MTADAVVWLRPEYQGRDNELIHLAAAADLVGVTRSAVSNWAARHANFPKIAMLAGPRSKRTKWVVREEFITFAREQLNRPSGPRGGKRPRRPRTEILGAKVAHHEAQVERLAALEAKQAAALERTRATLAQHRDELVGERKLLEAEVDALGRNV